MRRSKFKYLNANKSTYTMQFIMWYKRDDRVVCLHFSRNHYGNLCSHHTFRGWLLPFSFVKEQPLFI